MANTKLVEELLIEANISQESDNFPVVQQGLDEFLNYIQAYKNNSNNEQLLDREILDLMIAELDAKLSEQVDLILHHPDFQRIEKSWTSINQLVKDTNFDENVILKILDINKETLNEDFEFTDDITETILYNNVYNEGYGQFGGQPTSSIIGDYEFKNTNKDLNLLKQISQVAAIAHAPFVSSVAPEFFGLKSFTDLHTIKNINVLFESGEYDKYNTLREQEESRYLALTTTKTLLRTPYSISDNNIKSFNYNEETENHNDFLWGNSAYKLAQRMVKSFEDYRWNLNIIGSKNGGKVSNLPLYSYYNKGEKTIKVPTEVYVSDRKEMELAEQGFITLAAKKGTDEAVFFSANSIKKTPSFPNTEEGNMAKTNSILGSQLPYLMLVSRLAHYIKIIQREHIGSWVEKQDIERELNLWLKQYIADQDNPPENIRSLKPLRQGEIKVVEDTANPGWYKVQIQIKPHFKYMGANFELSLVGVLDKKS